MKSVFGIRLDDGVSSTITVMVLLTHNYSKTGLGHSVLTNHETVQTFV